MDKEVNVIEVKDLYKSFGKIRAVDGASFSVKKGEIFGLLGPNGAGKTTILEILESLKTPDRGSASILGKDLASHSREIKHDIGVVLQRSDYFRDLSVVELLRMFASFYKRKMTAEEKEETIKNLLHRFDLENISTQRFFELSGGQRQRFVLALALVNKPKLVFLDEPTTGLDPQVRQSFWDIILSLRAGGLTIMITTHYMDEAEILCDRVGIIDHGKIVAVDRPVKLINSLGVASRIKFMSSKPINLGELETLPGVVSARRDRYFYDLETNTPEKSLRQLLEWEKAYSGKIFNLQVQQATLEDVFLRLTGRSLRQ